MIFIDEFKISVAASYDKWISSMEEALAKIAEGSVTVPKRTHIDMGKDALLLMPSIEKEYFATKIVSFFPLNILENKPSIYGIVILNDRKTGEPLAVIDGAKLTAMRTAAVSGIGIKFLSDEQATSVGVIGAGIQGFHQALFACSQREITKLFVYDNRRELLGKFCSELRKVYPRIKIAPAVDAHEICEKTEIIITATNSFTPVLPSEKNCLKGKTIIAIGSYSSEMRELPDELFELVDYVFIDSEHGMSESGDLIDPVNKGLIRRENFRSIYDLMTGTVKPVSSTRLFKTVGFAAFDLYAAILVYKSYDN
jgi:ornithine cyclodeaminase/alanine dehydrogenase-like protein (mu-crystallin family)